MPKIEVAVLTRYKNPMDRLARLRLRAVSVAVLFALASVAHSAGPEAADTSRAQAKKLPEILVKGERESGYKASRASTATRTDAEVMDIPQVVLVVLPQLLIDQQARSLDDAVKNVSGITMGNNFGHTADSLFIRGFGGGFFGQSSGLLRDGARSQTSRNFSITSERVEVIKGPSSLLYGIQNPGAVVNVISKKPLPERRAEVNLIGNSFGGGSVWFDVSTPLSDQAGFRFLAEREDSDYWRNFGEYQRTLIAPSFAWTGERLLLNVNMEYLDFDVPFDRGTIFRNGAPVDVPYERRFGEPFEKMNGISKYANAQAQYQLSDRWKLRGILGWSNEVNSDRRAMVGIPGISATGDVRRTVQGVDNRERDNRYATLDLQGAFKLGSIEHDVLFGIDAELLDSVDPSFFRQPLVVGFNVFNPIYRVLQPPTTVTAANTFAWQRTQSEIDNASLFLQDSMRIGERWIVLLGLRYQESEQFATSRNLRLSVPVDVVTNNSKHDVVLPRVGVVYRPRSWLAWYANFSESFVPNVFNADIVGPLDPEEGVIYEIGSKLDLDNGIAATMAVFNIDRENILVNVGGVSRTAGKARSRGFEIDLSGKLSQSLDLSATYANTDAKTLRDQITTEGKRLQNSARNIGSVFLTYRAGSPDAGGQWSFGGGARYVGERPVDNVNTFLLDAYTVADVYAAYRWQTGAGLATVRLNVKNAFDKEHYTGAIGGVITDTGGGSIYLGAPRQILMQIGLEF